jgi:hypothetical protein
MGIEDRAATKAVRMVNRWGKQSDEMAYHLIVRGRLMNQLLRMLVVCLICLIVCWPDTASASASACGSDVQIVKKPGGLRKTNPGPSRFLRAKDRELWRSVLNWPDECEQRSRAARDIEGGWMHEGIFIYPIGENNYIVDVECAMTDKQSEHIYYKITEHADTIESRLLILEQFYYIFAPEGKSDLELEGTFDPEGEYIRFKDFLSYGQTPFFWDKPFKPRLTVEKRYIRAGGCGLLTIYDVSGDCAEVIEFRANLRCLWDTLALPQEWELIPAETRAKWREAPNPYREDWKSSPEDKPACTGKDEMTGEAR